MLVTHLQQLCRLTQRRLRREARSIRIGGSHDRASIICIRVYESSNRKLMTTPKSSSDSRVRLLPPQRQFLLIGLRIALGDRLARMRYSSVVAAISRRIHLQATGTSPTQKIRDTYIVTQICKSFAVCTPYFSALILVRVYMCRIVRCASSRIIFIICVTLT
jgi:hypothetical protein